MQTVLFLIGLSICSIVSAQNLEGLDKLFLEAKKHTTNFEQLQTLKQSALDRFGDETAADLQVIAYDEENEPKYVLGEKFVCNVVSLYFGSSIGVDTCIALKTEEEKEEE